MTSVAHMDSPNIVDVGLTQMLTLVVNQNSNAELDVHLIGGFEDASPQCASDGTMAERKTKLEGYSFPLCAKIVETLQKSRGKFHLQTLHVLGHNTRWDSKGNACPIFHGFLGGIQVKLCGIAQYGNLIGVTIGYTITASISMVF
ncbi:unnamed protein product [Camellia sinensis]